MDVSRDGVVRCLLAAVLFGAAAPAASRLAGSMPAFTLAGLLYLGAALAVSPSVLSHPPSRRSVAREWRPALTAVVVGGALGPVLLMAGLARTSAATGSILLNTELAATAVLAAVFFREHLGGRLLVSVGLVTAAGVLLTWQPGASIDVGALLIIAACMCWGLDNCVTAAIEHLAPADVVALKGVVAGTANLVIGVVVSGWGDGTTVGHVLAAVVIGAGGYGISTVLWVQGARQLGATRGQVVFATAPFIGAAIAWVALGDAVTRLQVLAAALAVAGVAVSLRSAHEHAHTHGALVHDHDHAHDDGHHHVGHHREHDSVPVGDLRGRHRHVHRHREFSHSHPHVPDLHHRHEH